jgi:large repetitive protein
VSIPESVAGTVVDANRSDAPIPGAFVAANFGGVAVASTSTDAAGGFTLDVDWGTYYLVASAPGFAPMKEVFVVHANLTGLRFALATMTYTVSGTVTDALTGAPLNAIQIAENTTLLGASSPSGTYSFQLPNGTFELTAASTSGTSGAYAPLTFGVDVAGHDVLRNFELTETSGAVTGVVVDGDSGLPVPDASVSVFGSGSTTRIALVGVSSSGAFSVALTPGSYVLNISAPGYEAASVAVQVPVTTGPLTVVLTPAATPGSLGTAVPLPILVGAILGVLVAVVAVVIWRRRQPPPPPPRWRLEDLDEPQAEAVEARWGPGLT